MEPSNMSVNWILPSEINLKKCKRKFKQLDNNNKKIKNGSSFVIRALNEDEKDEAMVLLRKALFITKEDPRISALQFDAESTASLDGWIMAHFNQNIVFGCFLEERHVDEEDKKKIKKNVIQFKLVAIDVLYVREKSDTFPEPSQNSGEAFGRLMTCIKEIEKRVWSVVGVNKRRNILTSFGVFTSEEFKNSQVQSSSSEFKSLENIPIKMIENRRKLARVLGIKVLGAAFIGKDMKQAKTEAKTYKDYVHVFESEDSQELGLSKITAKDKETVFPITILGAKIILPKVNSIPRIGDKLEFKFSGVSKNFNVVHINAQSIPAHHYAMLANLYSKNIHAILVSESWLEPLDLSVSYFLPYFQLIRNDRVSDIKDRGGGVAIYLRENIRYIKVSESPQPPPENAGEHLFLEITFIHVKVLLGVYYCPSKKIDYFLSFKKILENLTPSYSHTIIMGDFNTCLLKNDSRSSKLRSTVQSLNLSILDLKNPTHHKPNCKRSLLDLIIVSSPKHVSKHGQVQADMFSYHDLLFLSYKISPDKECSKDQCKKKFDLACLEINIAAFKAYTQAQTRKKNWVCPECICSKPKRRNSETLVSTNTPKITITIPMNNVNIQRGSQTHFSPIIKDTDSLLLEELKESKLDMEARMDSQANAVSLLLKQFSQTKNELDNVIQIMTLVKEKEDAEFSQDRQTRKITTELSDNFPSTSNFAEVVSQSNSSNIPKKPTKHTHVKKEKVNKDGTMKCFFLEEEVFQENSTCIPNPIEAKESINAQKEDNEFITKPTEAKELIHAKKEDNESITKPNDTKEPVNEHKEDNKCISNPIEAKEPINVKKEDNEFKTKPTAAKKLIYTQKENYQCITKPIETEETINAKKEDNECITNPIEAKEPINVQIEDDESGWTIVRYRKTNRQLKTKMKTQ